MYENQHYGGDRQMKQNGNGRLAQEEASFRKAAADTQFFWNQVTRNNGALRKVQKVLNPQNKAREESQLFGSHTDVQQGIIQDSIPVERSGPGAENVPVLEKFSDLNNLPSFIARNIRLMKYESPSPIQKHSVPLGLAGLDLMCCAQTGSGKTFAFLLPVIASIFTFEESTGHERSPSPTLGQDAENGGGIRSPSQLMGQVDERGCMPKAIILAPTRELACQIHTESKKLCHNSDMKTVVVYGGSDIRAQLAELSTGCDMIVATPGRLNDLVDRGVVSFCKVIFLVLDEADRMLDMGFEPQIRRIVQENDMPSKDTRQTFLFSATFPDEIQSLAREFLRDYVWIGVGRVGSTVENIQQRLMEASSDPNMKMDMLLAAINEIEGRTLVFVQKKRTAAWVCQCLQQFGVVSEEIHGDRTQMQREHALRQFREGRTRVLVATDVAARGLDVPSVTHVIQFDMPISAEDFDTYVHRIGRTGRAGKSGVATSFYVPGRETGEGNGKIAQLIMRLLQENNQTIPEWFLSMDDHRYGGGGGGMRRAPYNKGPQGRGASFGGRDVRGYQPQQSQGQGGYGSASGSGSGGYNGYNQGQNQQGAPRMLQQGHVQNQGPRPFKQYGQGQGYQNDEQQSQGQSNYQQVSSDNQYQQQQQQHQLHPPSQPYNRQQQLQQQPAPARYNSQGSHVDSTQYGHQVPYNNMTAGQSYVPPIVGGNVQQATYYDNYGNVYNTPGGGAGAPVDTVTTQMVHMSVTPGQGQSQSQGQNQVQTQHRVHQQNTERAADPMISYVPVVTAVATEGTVRTPPVQGYMATASMVPAPQYIQSMQQPNASVPAPQYNQSMRQPNAPVTAPQYNQSMQQPNAPVPQVIYGNTVYSQAQGQGQEQQNQNYGGRGYSAGGSGGRGMGGRPLNVDARPFNSYQSGNNQNNNQGRDYYNNGYNQGHGHGQQMNFEQQGGNMGNQNVYSNENHAYSQQQHVYMPQSTANRMPAGNNGHNGHNAGRGESYPAAQGAISRGGDGEPLGIDGCNHVGVAENDNSNQLKTSDTSASS